MPDSHSDPCKGHAKSNHSIPHSCDHGAHGHSDIKPHLPFIIAFDILHILALVSIIAILSTACFSSRVRRSTAWFSFNFTMLLSCMGYLLILGQQTGPLPDHNVCLFQAMLVYASPALNALSFVALTLEIFLALSGKTCGSRTKMMVLFFVPYGVFIGILIEVLILGLLNPDAVVRGRNGFICGISIRVPIILTVAIVICAMIAFIILGGRIAVQCRRRCRSGCQILSTHNSVPFALVLRVAFFGIFSILTIGFTIIFMFSAFHVYSDLSLAVLHLTVGIVFGSQKDILSVWMFWRKLPDTLPTSTTATETTNSKDSTIETQP